MVNFLLMVNIILYVIRDSLDGKSIPAPPKRSSFLIQFGQAGTIIERFERRDYSFERRDLKEVI